MRPPEPVHSSLQPVPAEPGDAVARAVAVLRRHADHPSAFLALNAETRHFTAPGIDGLIAYRPAGRRHLAQVAGVLSAPADAVPLLDAFLGHARAQGREVVAAQLLRQDVAPYVDRGFRVDQLGAHYALRLDAFTTRGGRFVKLRNKIARARRAGVRVQEVGVDVPPSPDLMAHSAEVERQWLRGKGRSVHRLEFLVGERGGPADAHRRLFVAVQDEQVVGDLSLAPVFGRHPGWLHDLTHRRPDAPPGVAELLTLTALERIREEGAPWLHLGFTPFVGLSDEHRFAAASSPVARLVTRLLAEHGRRIYPAADQAGYKEKWGPHLVEPEYIAFQRAVTPRAVLALLRLTRAL